MTTTKSAKRKTSDGDDENEQMTVKTTFEFEAQQMLDDDRENYRKLRCWCRVSFWMALVSVLLVAFIYEPPKQQDPTPPTHQTARPTGPATAANQTKNARRLQFGMDPSEAKAAEGGGVQYRDLDGVPLPALAIAHKYGHQWARVRVMVDPDGRYGLFQDLDYVMAMARDIKHTYGMQLLLDFHYSHWWSDGDNQWIPLSWRKRTRQGQEILPTVEELQKLVYHHTYEVLQALQAQGTMPDAVQVGNEIMSGMLWDEGRIPDHWKDFVQITQSGVQAIKDVVLSSSKSTVSTAKSTTKDGLLLQQETGLATAVVAKMPKIVIHLDQGGDMEGCERWFQSYLELGGTVDIIGLSYYPMWHGSFANLTNNINNLGNKFGLDVWVVETAYFWKGDPCDKTDTKCQEILPFDQTEEGQFQYLQAIRNVLETNTTHCQALFYWGSHWSQAEKWFVNSGGNDTWEEAARRALFDDEGRALKGWTAWNTTDHDIVDGGGNTRRFLRL